MFLRGVKKMKGKKRFLAYATVLTALIILYERARKETLIIEVKDGKRY